MGRFQFRPFHFLIGIAVGTLAIVALLFFDSPRTAVSRSFDGALTSVRSFFLDTGKTYGWFREPENVKILENERNTFAGMLADQTTLADENEHLRELLAFKKKSNAHMLGAHIIGKSMDPARSMFVIDRGKIDGVQEDLPVIADNGILIGKIADVQYSTSDVRLLHDPKSKTLASYKSKNRNVQGLVTGKFHTGLEVTLVPITEPIEKNALVVTTGTQENIPAGLLIGFVSDYSSTPTDLFYNIQVKPALLTNDLTLVSIILPDK